MRDCDAKLTEDELDAIRHVAEHGSNPSGYIIRLLNEHAELTVEITELRAQLAEFT